MRQSPSLALRTYHLTMEGYSAMPLRRRLIQEMKAVFGDDSRRIDHALRVLDHAETIQQAEGGDLLTVQAAAALHDIDIHEAQRKHGSSAARFQEIEGPPIARPILEKLGFAQDTIDHVCRIIASHHSANDVDSLEFRAVWDADWLVNVPDEHATDDGDDDAERLRRLVRRVFKTSTGRDLARSSPWYPSE